VLTYDFPWARHEGLFESQLQEIGTTGSMRGDFAVLA
jgi:hypothetical protein